MQSATPEALEPVIRELKIEDVCQHLGKCRQYVIGLIREKRVLRARWEGNQYRIHPDDLKTYIDSTYISVDKDRGP